MATRSDQPEPLLTPGEVAAMFRVDPKTVTRWAKAGKLSAIRTLGAHRRYREAEVRALFNREVPEQEQFRIRYWAASKVSGRVAAVYGACEGRPSANAALGRAVRDGHADAWIERWDTTIQAWVRVTEEVTN